MMTSKLDDIMFCENDEEGSNILTLRLTDALSDLITAYLMFTTEKNLGVHHKNTSIREDIFKKNDYVNY